MHLQPDLNSVHTQSLFNLIPAYFGMHSVYSHELMPLFLQVFTQRDVRRDLAENGDSSGKGGRAKVMRRMRMLIVFLLDLFLLPHSHRTSTLTPQADGESSSLGWVASRRRSHALTNAPRYTHPWTISACFSKSRLYFFLSDPFFQNDLCRCVPRG